MSIDRWNPASKQNSITTLQFILTIHSMQLGVAALSMPGDLARISGTDGWIALFFGWMFSSAASLIIVQIMKAYPSGTIIELMAHFFGKWTGKLTALLFGVYMSIFAYLILDRMALLIQSWIMQQSKTYILMLLFFVPAYTIVIGGVRAIGRYCEIVVLLSLWMLGAMLFLLKEGNWLHLLPVLKEGWMPVIRTINTTIISFLGFESVFFLYPHLDNKKNASWGVLAANTYTLLIYLFLTLICFLVYSPDQISEYNEALLTVVKIIEFRFMERFDIIMLACYLLVISKTWVPALYFGAFSVKRLLIVGKPKRYAWLFLAVMFAITYVWDPDWNESQNAMKWFSRLGLAVAYVMPVLLWGVLSILLRFKRWQT
ncbi:GerAB/ArcD/ProY family transporter [Paenibacillus sacheonensis]|uniref:GerAB/ArcD/ProY family transporter n=1 Tax=Paenibacillus sacheonensis TaxID=742054 RepID=A0A7X4YL02_9BACL|nr:GerAB/ArcD/ProY family transporter [Paenibacillus sacheonensis]MBM7563192.1 spore germination protein (amino acid permease) [Paenibacillus sacheonensis]NBC68245.1 GerAB/ArcD/ProY family transporter [Paenibacillus sacheonensis]